MNTLTLQSGTDHTPTVRHCTLLGILLGIILALLSMIVDAEDRFQTNALFKPSEALLRAESRGRIMIYDGLESEVVEHALDEQFGRIEHMMFTRIRHTEPDGSVIVEDDGC